MSRNWDLRPATNFREFCAHRQEIEDRVLVVSTLREAMVEANERATRVLARDVLRSIGEDA